MLHNNYITDMVSRCKYEFTTDDLVKDYDITTESARKVVQRMHKRGEVISPVRSFHVIVPLERQHIRHIEVYDYIDNLMKRLDCPYYIGLLSAADLHGAAHQAPQVFQVVTNRQIRNIEFRKNMSMSPIHFTVKKSIDSTSIMRIKNRRGMMNVSTPEETLFDLVRYPREAGGFGNIATIAVDMSEEIDAKELHRTALKQSISQVQKAGFILESVREHDLANAILPIVLKRPLSWIPLSRLNSTKERLRDSKWKVIINTCVVSDYDCKG